MDYGKAAAELMALMESEHASSLLRKTKTLVLPRGKEILGSEQLTTALYVGSHPVLTERTPVVVVADDECRLTAYAVLEQQSEDGDVQCRLHLSDGNTLTLDGGVEAAEMINLMAGLSSGTRLFDFRVTVFRDDTFALSPKLAVLDPGFPGKVRNFATYWEPRSKNDKACNCECYAFCANDSSRGKKCDLFSGKCHGKCSADGNC